MPRPGGTPENLTKKGCNWGNKGGGRTPSQVSKRALQAADDKGLPYLIQVASGEVEATVLERLKAIERLGTWGGLNKTDVTSNGETVKAYIGFDPEEV